MSPAVDPALGTQRRFVRKSQALAGLGRMSQPKGRDKIGPDARTAKSRPAARSVTSDRPYPTPTPTKGTKP